MQNGPLRLIPLTVFALLWPFLFFFLPLHAHRDLNAEAT